MIVGRGFSEKVFVKRIILETDKSVTIESLSGRELTFTRQEIVKIVREDPLYVWANGQAAARLEAK